MPRKPKLPQKEISNGRDLFQTPNYATELLVPFIPKKIKTIWECAVGGYKIYNVLASMRFNVIGTDINERPAIDFLKSKTLPSHPLKVDMIITNPPYSLKRKFYEHCLTFQIPFALLIPADYSGWIIKAVQDGAEKIIPTRRIDYITPTGLSGGRSSSMFHSMWLTWGFKLGKTETFVELTQEMKKNI
jgi:hypothetical protein